MVPLPEFVRWAILYRTALALIDIKAGHRWLVIADQSAMTCHFGSAMQCYFIRSIPRYQTGSKQKMAQDNDLTEEGVAAADPGVSIPRYGSPVRGSQSGQPIMVLFDLLSRRWAMGILWNLAGANRTFRDLQARCNSASPTVLNTRLKELRAAGLVTKAPDGYALTDDGRSLFQVLEPLGDWAMEWAPRQKDR